jgi:cysteine desulfurase/selenocysteine lyase
MTDNSIVVLRYGKNETAAEEMPLVKEDLLIGRAAECDIQLDDPMASRFHASLKVGTDGFWLRDMDSTNGTLVDDKPIPPNQRTSLRPGQVFKIGSYSFFIQLPHAEEPAQPVAAAPDLSQQTMIKPGGMPPPRYDVDALRKAEFPHVIDQANLNNAATVPTPLRTQKKMMEYFEKEIINAHWHMTTHPVDYYMEFVAAVSKLLNAEASEIGAVEGCSAGLNYIAQALDIQPGENIIFCDHEYPANAYPWLSLKRDGAEIKMVPPVNGGLTLESVQEAATERTRVVAASAVQFFSGHRTDMAAIGKFCRERNFLFVVDAIQAIGHMPIDVKSMNIDVLVTGGHKSIMAGPGFGFLYVRDAVSEALKPRLIGSVSTMGWTNYLKYDLTPHEGAWRFVLGTPNFMGQQGMVASISLINELTREAIDRHTTRLAEQALEMATARGYELLTTPHEHGPIATFKSRWTYEETMAFVDKLEEEQDIFIGKTRDRQDNAYFRMSFHCYNTEEDLQRAFDAIDKQG